MKQLVLFSLLVLVNVMTFAKEKEVVLRTKTGDLFGTLLVPEGGGKHESTVALLICGSGPTDRDGNSIPMQLVNNSIKYLAEELCSVGISSLRYDKRAIGKSARAAVSEDVLRFNTYSEDAREWIELLAKEYDKVIVIGHSEGAMLGILSCIDNQKVTSLVLLAGCGRPADVVLKEQLSEQWGLFAGQAGVTKEKLFSYIDLLKKGETINDVPSSLYSLFRPSVQPYMISWFAVDPVKEIKKVKVPILIVQGDKDIQIRVKDAELLHEANKKSKIVIIPMMNHVFKECNTMDKREQMKLYNNQTMRNVPQLSACIIEFIQKGK